MIDGVSAMQWRAQPYPFEDLATLPQRKGRQGLAIEPQYVEDVKARIAVPCELAVEDDLAGREGKHRVADTWEVLRTASARIHPHLVAVLEHHQPDSVGLLLE